MLDTNVISDVMREPNGKVAARLEAEGENTVCCSIVVACELRYGAAKAKSSKLEERVEAALSAIDVLPLDAPADEHYASIRDELTRAGTLIGANDLLIAAHALSQELILVTDNLKEFRRVSELAVVNWRAA